MPWTKTQKQIAARACKEAGIDDAQRLDFILRNFKHARDDDGRITSTAPKLNNRDFENFMAIVESHAGGRVLHYALGFWAARARDGLGRMRDFILRIAGALENSGHLHPGGVGLAGWINKRVTGGETDRLEHLDYHGLLALLLGLQAYARQHGVSI